MKMNNNLDTKYPIKTIIEKDGNKIVLLEIPKRAVDELNNILCYDKDGELLWQIDNKLPSNIRSKDQMPYVDVRFENEELIATDFWGRRFSVDIKSGKLIDVRVVK